MRKGKSPEPGTTLQDMNVWSRNWVSRTFDPSLFAITDQSTALTTQWLKNEIIRNRQSTGEQTDKSKQHSNIPTATSQMTLAEFVETRFVPEHAATKSSAGRIHFQTILKHVLIPEVVDRAFGADEKKSRAKLKTIPGWPYLDAIPLGDICPDHIQQIVSAALDHGYSTQTAIHIRNVIRKVFSHAFKRRYFAGVNPAILVELPQMIRKEAHVLTPDQLQTAIRHMQYPEREMVFVSLLTDLSVAEICGLQWKYVNLSHSRRIVDGEWISPRTIAVRKASSRSELTMVTGSRRRGVPIPDLLSVTLQTLKRRSHLISPDAFVFASRSGTPINQDNIAARRLRVVGRRIEMPWLSWHVFQRTNLHMKSKFGKRLHEELRKWMPFDGARTAPGRPSRGANERDSLEGDT